MQTQTIGAQAEQMACEHLQQQGLTAIQRNFHSRYGEIDLIMQDGCDIVFVEVRYRRGADFGSALESVDWHKQQRLIKTAQLFLHRYPRYSTMPARFDVVSFEGDNKPTITWLKNAFTL